MKYLSTPCPRCGNKTLCKPEPHKRNKYRLYSLCETCGKKSLYQIHDKANGERSYSIVLVGRPGREMIRATFWIKKWHAEELAKRSHLPRQKSQIVRDALDREFQK